MNELDLYNRLPERIRWLAKLSYNLYWSWCPEARQLFRMLDIRLWRETGHNPVKMLGTLPEEILLEASTDPEFLRLYDAVMDQFQAETVNRETWFDTHHDPLPSPIAYFSAEYGLHASLPVYAGGLGVLAGDYLKSCSDLGVPIVGIGLIYSQGYVRQCLREDGWQEDVEEIMDRSHDPIQPVLDEQGQPIQFQVPLFDPPVHVTIWKVALGRISLYLMDTNLESNQPWDRGITQRLYANDPELRLRQEIVLGMGGMRVLRALGIAPSVLHLNEGHPALAIFERIKERVRKGLSFEQAAEQVRATTVFTTHTPVAAGTDIFPLALMDRYFLSTYRELGSDRETILNLGISPVDPGTGFNMTAFALRMSHFRNAVSQKHGEVARRIWAPLWPDKKPEEVPIEAITNGIHLPSWIEPTRLQEVIDRALGPHWRKEQDKPETWEDIDRIPDVVLWHLHQDLKVTLVARINERARKRWNRDRLSGASVIALGSLLNPEVLTLGFARRFTPYKRPELIFHDMERFKRILTNARYPVQVIFAGKSHPADLEGKYLVQRVFRWAQEPDFAGRIAFVENYDQQLAKYLTHGVDVWLTNPLPPLEASGTSGMKAAVNGTPNLSILDGWWIEGYNGANGWAFGSEPVEGDRNASDANAIYEILEKQIIPLYYKHSDDEIPHDYVHVMKESIKSVAPRFSGQRMAKEYLERFYLKAVAGR
jgi:starch phosphorylase